MNMQFYELQKKIQSATPHNRVFKINEINKFYFNKIN